MLYELKQIRMNIPDHDLLNDLKSVAKKINKDSLTMDEYEKQGRQSRGVYKKRFGSWNNALRQAGLLPRKRMNIPDAELFNNIVKIWLKIGRQPRQSDFNNISIYKKRFGTYNKALDLFIKWINLNKKTSVSSLGKELNLSKQFRHKTKREISDRLKVKVLMRDVKKGVVKCELCGKYLSGKEVHYDHIKPWAKGGETVLDNLQILCVRHNLAKGDYYPI